MTELEQLVEVSRRYGADSRFVIAGGGNTSYKDNERLWVKASGHAMATITEDGFAVLDRNLLNKMGEKVYSSDPAEREDQVKNDLAAACITKGRRPSVETSLHNAMSARFIVHLHPTAVNGVMCSNNAEKACSELFGADALYIPYTDPGYTLFKKVYDEICAFKAAKGHEPKVIMLQNHGVFVGADTVAEIDAIYADMLAKIEARVKPLDMTPTDVCDCAVEVVPAIRSILSREGRGDKIILPRNVHRSAINALVVNGAVPIYVNPGRDKRLGIPLGMSVAAVEKAIAEHPDAKAILVNNPT